MHVGVVVIFVVVCVFVFVYMQAFLHAYFAISYSYTYILHECVSFSEEPALAVSISVTPNLNTWVYAGTAVTFHCNVGYSGFTGAEIYLWRSTCIRDCTVWGQTSQQVTIDLLKPSDTGNYTCTVSRAAVSMSASVIIFVVGKFGLCS